MIEERKSAMMTVMFPTLKKTPAAAVMAPLVVQKKSNKRSRPEDDDSENGGHANARRTKKCVRWSTVTVYEFGVTIGGSAVPRRGGPSIGLSRKLKTKWSTTVDDIDYDMLLSGDTELSKENVVTDTKEKLPRRLAVTRRHRVRWFKPQERVQLLTKAGCSEKRIYRTMMESSEIAMSRRLCLSVLRDVTV